MIILDKKATTDSKNGCVPAERTLEQLLDAGVILVDKSADEVFAIVSAAIQGE